MAIPQEKSYTIEDIYRLPEGRRAELIDGQIYYMAPPTRKHQRIVTELSTEINRYIKAKKDSFELYVAPFAVFLTENDKTYTEPDISIICDKHKLDEKGCHGAPDWIIEIASPSTQQMDYSIKLFKYRTAGVKEYWIVNPVTCTVTVYDFAHETKTAQHLFTDTIPSITFKDFSIAIADLLS